MRFIVEVYRYLLLAVCGLTIIAAALLAFAAVDPSGPLSEQFRGSVLLIAAGLLLLLILNLGVVAVLISIHDRHAEIADHASTISAQLSQRSNTPQIMEDGHYAA